jgi:hypothetical protein
MGDHMTHITTQSGDTFEVQSHGVVGILEYRGAYCVVKLPSAHLMHERRELAHARILATMIDRIGMARWFAAIRIYRATQRGARRGYYAGRRLLRSAWSWQEYNYGDKRQHWLALQSDRLVNAWLNYAAEHDDYCYEAMVCAVINSDTWPERIADIREAMRTSAQHCRDKAAITGSCHCGVYQCAQIDGERDNARP